MSDKHIQLSDELRDYMLSVSLREEPILQEIHQFTKKLVSNPCLLLPEQGQLLAWLIKVLGVHQALEIGTYTGYSSTAIALALPPNGKLISCDRDAAMTENAKRFWKQAGVQDKIELRLGEATETLNTLLKEGLQEKIDFVFIDADKENYLAYYELSLRLLKPNGVMIFDNTLWYGAVIDKHDQRPSTVAIRELNQFLQKDQRIDLSLLPLGDGTTLVRKK
jgi:predicted O-methyltransferase YrrM